MRGEGLDVGAARPAEAGEDPLVDFRGEVAVDGVVVFVAQHAAQGDEAAAVARHVVQPGGKDFGAVGVVGDVKQPARAAGDLHQPRRVLRVLYGVADARGVQRDPRRERGEGGGEVAVLVRAGHQRRTRQVGGKAGQEDALSGAHNARFFAGDAVDGIAEPVLVVEADAGDDGGVGVDEVGRVQPSAKADFEYGDLRLAAGDEVEGGKC